MADIPTPAKAPTTAQHTPGPWTWRLESNRRISPPIVIYSTHGSIASIELPDERDAANARLIAAAPDLLASLTELVNSPNAKQNAAWDRARAAIAAATVTP